MLRYLARPLRLGAPAPTTAAVALRGLRAGCQPNATGAAAEGRRRSARRRSARRRARHARGPAAQQTPTGPRPVATGGLVFGSATPASGAESDVAWSRDPGVPR